MSSSYFEHNNFPSLPNQQEAPASVSKPMIGGARRAPVAIAIAAQPFEYDPMLTERQAAVVLNKPMETLKKWRQRGEGPTFVRYHDGSIRYPISALVQYLKNSLMASTSRKNRE